MCRTCHFISSPQIAINTGFVIYVRAYYSYSLDLTGRIDRDSINEISKADYNEVIVAIKVTASLMI